ncbi:hypothetical protein [Streptomyces sp. NPDC005805]|uniref:hypothetical protein n=1 Tax=Streptomyces sp. NPDC005805 TaxID=3157068 RepID=UPI0033FABB99
MRKHLRAGPVAGLSVAVFGTMLAVPTQAVAVGKGTPKGVVVKFDCKNRTVSDRYGTTTYRGCTRKTPSGKGTQYKVYIKTKDTKRDGVGSHAAVWADKQVVLNVSAEGKGKESAWKSTYWMGGKGPYRVTA